MQRTGRYERVLEELEVLHFPGVGSLLLTVHGEPVEGDPVLVEVSRDPVAVADQQFEVGEVSVLR